VDLASRAQYRLRCVPPFAIIVGMDPQWPRFLLSPSASRSSSFLSRFFLGRCHFRLFRAPAGHSPAGALYRHAYALPPKWHSADSKATGETEHLTHIRRRIFLSSHSSLCRTPPARGVKNCPALTLTALSASFHFLFATEEFLLLSMNQITTRPSDRALNGPAASFWDFLFYASFGCCSSSWPSPVLLVFLS